MFKTNTAKKLVIFIVIAIMALPLFVAFGCSCEPSDSGEHVHVWREFVIIKEATCAENGLEERTCSVCGEKENKITEKTAHTFGEWAETKPATCAENGIEERVCSVCGEKESRITAKTEHAFGEWTETKPATCVENGLEERVCSVCGEKESRITAKAAHTFGEWIEEIPATSAEDGVKGHKDCLVCNKHFDADGNELDSIVIEKEHIFGEWIEEIPATYESDGVKGHYHCSHCGKYFDRNYNEISDLKIDKLVDENQFPKIETIDGKSYVRLGYYPQSVLKDADKIEELDALIKDGLTENDSGYYELDGIYYLKKTATPCVDGDSYSKFIDGTKIEKGKTYYFIVEPVLWRIVKTEGNKYTLISDMALDAQMFDPLQFAEENDGITHNPNDYSLSYIRSWLNEEFYEKAFRDFEKEFIVVSSVNNGASTLYNPEDDPYYTTYIYDNTSDKVFLPSYADMYNTGYGFISDADRMALATDYLRASGTYMVPMIPESLQIGYAKYWLRSAGGSNIQNVSIINCYGSGSFEGKIVENESRIYTCSVRPMLVIERPAH